MNDVSFQLRVQDLSRALDTWGTGLPVVGESDLFHQRVLTIADVPNTAEFRSLLRIYGFDPGSEGQIRVRVYALDASVFETGRGDQLILDTVQMVRPDPLAPVQIPPRLELPLWLIPQLEGHARLRIAITGGPELRLWGFVSATHNSTQHVTVLAPQ
ncbi:MAG TPA: hypothetical protein VMS12_12755 [Thermoanaerobaculia bacterium]|nr:hypothetical protein [Thermoanaerobaculia bacterium]